MNQLTKMNQNEPKWTKMDQNSENPVIEMNQNEPNYWIVINIWFCYVMNMFIIVKWRYNERSPNMALEIT